MFGLCSGSSDPPQANRLFRPGWGPLRRGGASARSGWDCPQHQQQKQQLRATERKKETPEVPREALCQGRSPDPKPSPPSRPAGRGPSATRLAPERGGGETEEPASRHGLGVTEFPGWPGGCGRQGQTTPAGAAAQRPARATATGAEPTGPGRLGGASRKRGPWAPLCEGRRRGAGQPPAAGSLDACLPAGVPVGPAASPPPTSLRGARLASPRPPPGCSGLALSPRPLPGLQFL
ncbi:TPA: hypothetical protein BOS_25222 [Bos taurus]|nr:TPA: hypothetical protein BOS_25222 [Bos taurus]